MIVYTAGLYSSSTEEGTKANIKAAREWAIVLWDAGFTVVCPQSNTAFYEKFAKNTTYDDFLRGYFEIIQQCDAVFFMPGWENSNGASIEHKFCEEHGIFIAHTIEELKEQQPYYDNERFKEMRKIQMKIYRTAIKKNKDYSIYNVGAVGLDGVAVRLWDKTCRIMNLLGFDIGTGEHNKPKNANYESLLDSLLDISCYGLIGMIVYNGKWTTRNLKQSLEHNSDGKQKQSTVVK